MEGKRSSSEGHISAFFVSHIWKKIYKSIADHDVIDLIKCTLPGNLNPTDATMNVMFEPCVANDKVLDAVKSGNLSPLPFEFQRFWVPHV